MKYPLSIAWLALAASLASAVASHDRRTLSRGRHALASREHVERGLLDALLDLTGVDPTEDPAADTTSSSTTTTTSVSTSSSSTATAATTSASSASSSVAASTTVVPTTVAPTTTTTATTAAPTSPACTPVVLLGITISGCDESSTTTTTTSASASSSAATTTVTVIPTVTGSDSTTDTGAATTTPTATGTGTASTVTSAPASTVTATTSATSTATECTPVVLLGITISPCDSTTSTSTEAPTTSASESATVTGTGSATTSAPPDTETGSATTSSTSASETDSCAPVVLLGATLLPCETPTTTSGSATSTGTTSAPGGGDDTTTTAPPEGTGSATTTSTQPTGTQTTDPGCDSNLWNLGGLLLPSSCSASSSSTGTGSSGGGSATDTGSSGPTTTTTSDGPGTTTTTDGNTTSTSVSDPGTTTTTTPILTVPTDIFPTTTGSDSDSATFSSTSTVTTPTDLPSVSIPTFVTQTSSLLIETDLPTTSTIVATETDPDAVETSTPAEQNSSTPTKQVLPNNLPSYILAASAPSAPPEGYTLVTIMLSQRLNWDWVASNSQTALQIITFAPLAVVNALNVGQSYVVMLALEAFIPQDWNRDPKSLLTLVEMYIPDEKVDELSAQLKAPNSRFYVNQGNQVELALVAEVDPSYPLTSGSSGAASGTGAGGNLDGLLGDSGSNAKDDSRKRAIIGVCAAIGGALALALAWWLYKYCQRSREMKHRRLSDGQMAYGAGYGAVAAGPVPPAMQERGRRDSFFFAADSLRGYEDGTARMYEDETYDHRSGSGHGHGGYVATGARSPQQGPIVPSHISAPILRENTLNW